MFLRQSTGKTVSIHGVMSSAGDNSRVSTLSLGSADSAIVTKAAGTVVDISGATFAAISGRAGSYTLTLAGTAVDTIGPIEVAIYDDDLIYPIVLRYYVLSQQVFDSLFTTAGTDYLQVDAIQIEGTDATDQLTTYAGGSGSGLLASGTAAAIADGTITLASSHGIGDTSVWVVITSGANKGQSRIATYSGTGDVFDVDPSWNSTVNGNVETTPSGTPTYEVWPIVAASSTNALPVDVTKINGNATAASNASSCFAGTITSFDALDTQQDAQHGTTQTAISNLNDPTAAAIRAEIDSNSTQLAAILADTGTDIPATLATIAVYIDTEIGTLLTNVSAILTDTGTTLDGKIDAIDAVVDAIKAVTDLLPDSGALSSLATASALSAVATNVTTMAAGIITGAAATGTLSTTQATTDLSGYTADQLIGRVIIWTSGNCDGEATDITDYAVTGGLLTFTALTTAPGNGDTFKIV